jgi:cardiolipin synthase
MSKTSWELYTGNEEGWGAMLDACAKAKESIDLEQFIFMTDSVGTRFIDICSLKAKEGVKVRFLWDAAGSFSFYGADIVDDLRSKGIELVFFKTLFPSILKYHDHKSWYLRNHRRTLVIDGKVGFTGSICFSNEMINWRDTVVRIDGPVVGEMLYEFNVMWQRALKEPVSYDKSKLVESEFRYVTNYPLPRRHNLYKEIIRAIRDAKKYVYITTPYFVPTRHLSRVIRASAKRGVDVKIIIPESSDHPIVDMCSRSFFTTMLRSGVKIYLYRGNMIHSKTIVIDDAWSTIGTLNLDTASLMYNFEANIVTTNLKFTKELKEHFVVDLLETREITYKEWSSRFWLEKLFGSFARLLRDFM